MKIKKIALFTALIMLLGLLAACSGNENNPQNTTSAPGNNNIDGTETENAPLDRSAIPDDLPEMDFGGYNFRFYTNQNTDYGNFFEIFAPESEIGEVVNDAVFRRNRTVEQRFNIDISTISSGSDQNAHVNSVRRILNAGDFSFDVAFVHCVWGPNLTIEGYA